MEVKTNGFQIGNSRALALILALAGRGTQAHHPYHEPVSHLAQYHYPIANNVGYGVDHGGVTNEASALSNIGSFLNTSSGWEGIISPLDGLAKIDYFQDSGFQELQFWFRNSSGMQAGCGSIPAACYIPLGEGQAGGTDLLHAGGAIIYVRATSYGGDPGWNGWSLNLKRDVVNHEVGHSLGLAEHYVNTGIWGDVATTTTLAGVMDNDLADSNGYPTSLEKEGAFWSVWGWY